GLVTRSVEEDNFTAERRRILLGNANLVSPDVLGDAARFARSHIGLPDGVQQRCLAMIYVAHDGHDRRTGDFNLADILILHEVFEGLVGHLVFKRNDLGIGAELVRQILYADAFCHRDRAGDWHRFLRNLRSAETRRRRKALHWAFLGLRILLPSAALLRSRSLRPGSFAWRRRQTPCTAHTGPWRTETRAGAEAGPRGAETRASAGAGSSTGLSP